MYLGLLELDTISYELESVHSVDQNITFRQNTLIVTIGFLDAYYKKAKKQGSLEKLICCLT